MKVIDFALLVIIFLWLIAVVIFLVKRKKSGKCIGCSGCDGKQCNACQKEKRQ